MNHIPRSLTDSHPGYACGDNSFIDQVTRELQSLGCSAFDAKWMVDTKARKVAFDYLMGLEPAAIAADLYNQTTPKG